MRLDAVAELNILSESVDMIVKSVLAFNLYVFSKLSHELYRIHILKCCYVDIAAHICLLNLLIS